jgi:branched-subunit amino acid ABC-type transport system permease component
MITFLALTVSGAVSGAVYSLLAAGLVLTYQTTGIFNFAQAAVAFTIAFLFYALNSTLGLPTWLAALLCIGVAAPLLGLVTERLVFRRLAHANSVARIIATVGLMIALPASILGLFELLNSAFHLNLPNGLNIVLPPGLGPSPPVVWTLAKGLALTSDQLIILGTAVLVSIGLWLTIHRSRVGLEMRATVDRRGLASMRGISPARMSRVACLLGFFISGLTGVVAAPLFSLDPGTYISLMFVAATAAVIGGLRSIPLAFAGGMVIGVTENLVENYLPIAQSIVGINTSVPFIIMLIALFFTGTDRSRAAGVSAESAAPDWSQIGGT